MVEGTLLASAPGVIPGAFLFSSRFEAIVGRVGGGAAGIYNVMTVPEAQRRGIGALMTVRPLELAQARGYQLGILQSSRMGYPLYRRLGFRDYCRIWIYLWPGEAASAAPSHPE